MTETDSVGLCVLSFITAEHDLYHAAPNLAHFALRWNATMAQSVYDLYYTILENVLCMVPFYGGKLLFLVLSAPK